MGLPVGRSCGIAWASLLLASFNSHVSVVYVLRTKDRIHEWRVDVELCGV